MVVLVDAASEHAAERTDALLNTIYRANGRTPFVVGLTHTDLEEASPEQALDGAFADDALALAPIDPRSDQAGHALLRRLLDHLSS
jgi:signal recognition particle receptor subunit beta